jgi:hypothetical protein
MASGVSYIVFANNGVYYAKNGTTGAIDYNSAIFENVMQDCIDTLPDFGGIIELPVGIYSATTQTIYINRSGVTIRGTIETDWDAPGGPAFGTFINRDSTNTLFSVNGNTRAGSVIFENLRLNGNSHDGSAIYAKAGADITIRTCNFRGFWDYAIEIDNVWGVTIEDCKFFFNGAVVGAKATIYIHGILGGLVSTHIRIADTSIDSSYSHGIRISNVSDCAQISNVYMEGTFGTSETAIWLQESQGVITDSYISMWAIGIRISGGFNQVIRSTTLGMFEVYAIIMDTASNGVIDGNLILFAGNTSDEVAVVLFGGTVVMNNKFNENDGAAIWCRGGNNTIFGNTFLSNCRGALWPQAAILVEEGDSTRIIANYFTDPFGTQLEGIFIYPSATNTTISQNHFDNCVTPIENLGNGTEFESNIGYVSENSGQANITGAVTTVTVNHGLATNPLIVIVTCNNTGAGNYSVSSITLSQFVISFTNQPGTNEWLFYWYAEV